MDLSEKTRRIYSTQELEIIEGDLDRRLRNFPTQVALGVSAGLAALCAGFLSDFSVFRYAGYGLLGMTGWCVYRSSSRRASLEELRSLLLDRWYHQTFPERR